MKQQDLMFIIGQKDNHQVKMAMTQTSCKEAYLQFFFINNFDYLQLFEASFLSRLPSAIQFSKQEQFLKKLIVKITKNSKNYQFIDVEARVGFFTFKNISIINIQGESPTHQIANCESGSFCTTYICNHNGKCLAFKCFQRQRFSQYIKEGGSVLQLAIQQYCILQLASLMQVGPKISNTLGFDIIAYQNCIQIYMEACQPLSEQNMQKFQIDLKQNLLRLHSLRIVHEDIKIENICFSKTFNKFVFIDFGMSKILQQSIGFKSMSRFGGSISYCSKQMIDLWRSETQKPIDLYYNDMICLSKTLEKLRKENRIFKIEFINKQKSLEKASFSFFNYHFAKYCFFQRKVDDFFNIISTLSLEQVYQIWCWSFNLKPSHSIKLIKNKLLCILRSNQRLLDQPLDREEVYQKLSQSLGIQTLDQLNVINKHCKVSYFLNQYHNNFSELIHFLVTPISNDLQVYLCLLSKALQVNANNCTLQQLESVSQIAFRRCFHLNAIESTLEKYENKPAKHFLLMSQFLFKKSFKMHLKGKYLQIYLSIINNVFIYQILTNDQIVNYFQELFQINMAIHYKTKALIGFLSALTWVYFLSFDLNNYYALTSQINELVPLLINKSKRFYNQNQINLLKIIITRQQMPQTFDFNNYEPQIKLWLYCNKMYRVNFEQQMQGFEDLQQGLSVSSHCIFQYYHFYPIYNKSNYNNPMYSQLLARFQTSLKKQENSPFLMLIKNIYLITGKNYKNIAEYVQQFEVLNKCQHYEIKSGVLYFLSFIMAKHNLSFRKLDLKIQKTYSDLLFSAASNIILKSHEFESREITYYNAINKNRFLLSLLCNQYDQDFQNKRNKRNKRKKYVSIFISLYFRLQNEQNNQKHKISNQQLMLSNVLLFKILTESKQYKAALSLAKYLNKLSNFTSSKYIHKQEILYYTFIGIIHEMELAGDLSVKEQNRQLYFQYAQIIEQNGNQQYYLQKSPILMEIVQLMYKYKPLNLQKTINNTAKKLLIFNSGSKIQNYLLTWQIIFTNKNVGKYLYEQYFKGQYLQIKDNPYNVIPLLHIYTENWSCFQEISNFVVIFKQVQYLRVCAKHYILKRIIFIFLQVQKVLNFRKELFLNKKLIYYGWIRLSKKLLAKMLLHPRCKKILQMKHNKLKKQMIISKLMQHSKNSQQSSYLQKQIVKIKYGGMKIRLNI